MAKKLSLIDAMDQVAAMAEAWVDTTVTAFAPKKEQAEKHRSLGLIMMFIEDYWKGAVQIVWLKGKGKR